MAKTKRIPIGFEDFKEMIDKNCYYVDKTPLIKDILDISGKVKLFTRPRRFGKTLNMSMLRYFFERSKEDHGYLFDGLQIAEYGEEYLKHQGRYPVISITLKDVEQPDYEASFSIYKGLVAREVWRHKEVLSSEKIMPMYRKKLEMICDGTADDTTYILGLQILSDGLYELYQEKTIILIDEYDVPLQNAYFNGFYDEMVKLIRSVFSHALKTNDSLAFGVLTGCLRISKESIFTGLNNLDVYSVTDTQFAYAYGFTEEEVRAMTEHYGIAEQFDEIKEWYDGYLFGETEIYNPWSVLKYVQAATAGNAVPAIPYWINTSSNSIIQELFEKSGQETRDTIEILVNGGTIEKPLFNDITYKNMDVNQESIWSFLLYTGYLKPLELTQANGVEFYFKGMIPNLEVQSIYKETFRQWFREQLLSVDKTKFLQAILDGDAVTFENVLNDLLLCSISYHDGLESFYHGFLTGLLEFSHRYLVESNRENGTGRSDIVITDRLSKEIAVVIETKSTDKEGSLDKECRDALHQIHEKKYDANLTYKGFKRILKYGIAFCGKSCRVVFEG